MSTPATTRIAEQYVELSHGRTRYFEAGTGHPIILLHGVEYTGGGDRWLPVMERLQDRFRVIAPDFLGWGFGDRFDREYSFAYLVDFVREFQDALGISSSHVVGHSMGGWVASLLAYESPDRIDRLVLVAAGGVSAQTLKSMTEFAPPTREDMAKSLSGMYRKPAGELQHLVEDAERKAAVPGHLDAYRKILNHMNDPANRQRYNLVRRLPHIKAPTLLVWGREDTGNTLDLGEKAAALIPNSRLVVLENCGHFVPTEKPEELSQLLVEFLS